MKGNVYDFSVDYNAIDKSDILNIHKYLMVKNNITYCLIQQVLFALLSFSGSLAGIAHVSGHTKCVSLNNQQCMTQPTLIN